MKEGQKPEYLEKTPGNKLQKMPHTKARNFKSQSETRTHTIALVASYERRGANHYTMQPFIETYVSTDVGNSTRPTLCLFYHISMKMRRMVAGVLCPENWCDLLRRNFKSELLAGIAQSVVCRAHCPV